MNETKTLKIKVGSTSTELPLNSHYKITKKNGETDTYLLVGMENRKLGMPSLRLQHSTGFFCYIRLDDIKKFELP